MCQNLKNLRIVVKNPESATEWQQYYALRWQILRAPWQQPVGSERDSLESSAAHFIALIDKAVVGVARLHCTHESASGKIGQIRYMAVDENYQRQGIGQLLLQAIEKKARELKLLAIELNARQAAMGFYRKAGYLPQTNAHTLYGSIPHQRMLKIRL